MKNKIYLILLITIMSITYSCKKEAGAGGRASITGKVYSFNYDNGLNSKVDSGFIGGYKVYLKYGTGADEPVADDQDTNYDGKFKFEYLRPGEYEVYVYTKKVAGSNLIDKPIVKTLKITKRNEVVDLGTINVITNKN